MGFDISALSAYTEENATEFFSRSVLGSKVAQTMHLMTGIKSAMAIPTMDLGYDLLQSDTDCTFDDGGNDLVIAQRTITPVDIKINEKYCVKELEPYFTQKILSPGGKYDDVPAELRLFDMMIARINKSVELALVRGVLGGASAISSFNLFDGMIETASNDIAAGDIPAAQQLTGALTASNVIASFRAMYDALPLDAYLNVATDGDWKIYCSPQAKVNYARDYQSDNGSLPYNTDFGKDFLDNTTIEIVALAGFAEDDSQAILTREGNYWLGTDIGGEENDLTLALGAGSEARDLFLTGVFKMGIQTRFPDEMVVNNIS